MFYFLLFYSVLIFYLCLCFFFWLFLLFRPAALAARRSMSPRNLAPGASRRHPGCQH
jgi:hypothetical protein